MEHRRHGKCRVVEIFPAEHSLMPLLCGLLLYLAETMLMRLWFTEVAYYCHIALGCHINGCNFVVFK
jgi:hypothetical protein